LLLPRGDGFFANFTARDAADNKRIALARAVSLKSACSLFCCCNRSAASIASTAATFSAQFQYLSAPAFPESNRRVILPLILRPATALHKLPRRVYTWLQKPVGRPHCLPGCRRPSSAVLGFEYGLPRAKQRTIGSPAGQSAPLPVCFLRFFPPIAVSVVLL